MRLTRTEHYKQRGETVKKTLSVILTVILLIGMSVPFMKAEAATLTSQAGIVSVRSGRLNVRKTASVSGTVLTSLTKGSYVTLISRSGDWYYVEYADGKYGYCHRDYLKLDSGRTATVNTQSTSLNVRTGAGTSYAIKGSVPKNDIVIILSTSGTWSRILYNGTDTGYVNSQYLRLNPTDGTGSGSSETVSYSAVSLSVPSFKQTDSRWANVKIGNSGKTIAQIGCATSAIAMMESYRTGTVIYPDAMSRKLTYSSSGNVYWPSNYSVVTSSSGYLLGIYQKLKLGSPVLFGAKTSSGGQHWVVITGYTGGSTLNASGFKINDPGSNSRINLQQFLNSYPIFYKYFYY